jgi:predicted nucleic acid-binding protein
MPVISDASPLILLAKIERINILKELYSEVIIPSQVRDEVIKQRNKSSSLMVLEMDKGWIKVEEVGLSSEVKEMGERLGLHEGEMYALSLALHASIKDFLADDKLARIAARILGLRAIGCLGIVRRAYEIGIITKNEAVEAIQKLVKAGLWVSPEVLGEVLTSVE